MVKLLWDIDTLRLLNEKGRALRTEILISLGLLDQPHSAQVESNLPRKLSGICTHLQGVVQGISFQVFSCYVHFCFDY